MATIAKILLGLLTAFMTVLTFTYLPDAQGFQVPHLARILGLHLPNAMAAIVAAVTSAVFAGRYLATRDLLYDAKSKVAAALTVLFCCLTTATGMIFANVQWGAPWNWDPKETGMFLLLLVYAAYFVLRASVDDPEKRASVASAYGIFAAIMAPLLGYVIPKYLPGLHPRNTTMSPEYHTVIWSMSACLIGVFAWLQNIGARYERVRLRLESEE